MADPPVSTIENLGVDSVEASHASARIRLRSFDQEVVMIGHRAAGVTKPPLLTNLFCRQVEKGGVLPLLYPWPKEVTNTAS